MTDKFKKRLSIGQNDDASIGNKRGKARRAKRNSNKKDRQRLDRELKTLEIVYIWPDGKEEVRYRRTAGTVDAQALIDEVEELKSRLKEECPYFYREI